MKELTAQYEPWATTFKEVYDRALEKYNAGDRRAANLVTLVNSFI